ncbi:MAG: hypothetical protein K8U57_28575 [Planctomycetes bacterium]|nr:hypothetical protein [Planctomycetota bacterium]
MSGDLARFAYQIDSFEIHIEVEPVHRALTNPRGEGVTHGLTTRHVRTDNLARLRRVVRFSKKNRLITPFRFLRYQTQNGGAIRKPEISGINEADAFEMGRYVDTGLGYVYQFTPTAGCEYFLQFELLKGFDRGHRHAHFHLPQPSLMQKVVLTLDLGGYLNSGFSLTEEPTLYLHTEEPISHDFCEQRGVGNLVPSKRGRPVWEWVLLNQTGGVIDVCWDVASPPGFEEVLGPAVAQGLERMADQALDLEEELRLFYRIGRDCLTPDREGVFRFNQVARQLGLPGADPGKDVSRDVDLVIALFSTYFRAYGHPPERPPFEVASGTSTAPEDEEYKLMNRQPRTPPRICRPVGIWAWELTRDFLAGRGLSLN